LKVYIQHSELPFGGWEVQNIDGVEVETYVQKYKTFNREVTDIYTEINTLDELKSLQRELGEAFFITFDDTYGYIKVYNGFQG
jgi:hypothetical protein